MLVESSEFGVLRLSRTRCFSSVSIGTKSSSEAPYVLFWVIGGRMDIVQGVNAKSLSPADMALCDTSRPLTYRVRGDETLGGGAVAAEWVTVQIPRSVLSCSNRPEEELSAADLSGRCGAGRVLLNVLQAFLEEAEIIDATARVRLSSVLLELLTVVVVERAEQIAQLPAGQRDSSVLQRIQYFAETRLAASDLTPTYLAKSHHISVRQLHNIFRKGGLTVSGWIRERRLEGWRRDLVKPQNRHKPVQAIAQKWGLRNSAHANRLFREMYGIAPAAYRKRMSSE